MKTKKLATSTSTLKYIHRFFTLLILSAACLIASQNTVAAGANLMVTPSRIVFDDKARTAQVTLLNTGTEAGSFRITFMRQQMTESGGFVKVKANEKGNFSDQMVRYSPRQVFLPAGQSQVIRLMLRKPKDLKKAEYRSHMLFQSLPKPSKNSVEKAAKAKKDNTISIEITPIVGISIPIIVRHGKLEDTLKIDNAKLMPGTEANPRASISVDMHRSGNRSVYGDFQATFTPNEGGSPEVIAIANGVAVYTPNTLRHFSIPLSASIGKSFNDGSIRVVFLESGKDESNGLIAETKLSLQ